MNIVIVETTFFPTLIITGLVLLIFIFLCQKIAGGEKRNCDRCGRPYKPKYVKIRNKTIFIGRICSICYKEYHEALENEIQKWKKPVKCETCGGSKKIKEYRCENCKGSGIVILSKKEILCKANDTLTGYQGCWRKYFM